MAFRDNRTLAWAMCISLIACALAHGECPVKTVTVKGRVEHSPDNAKIHVQLVYPKKQGGDSAEATIVNGTFSIPVQFLTQSRRPSINGLFEKCDRKPTAIVVTLVDSSSQEYDRVSLDLAKDFRTSDPTEYVIRSEIVLEGPE